MNVRKTCAARDVTMRQYEAIRRRSAFYSTDDRAMLFFLEYNINKKKNWLQLFYIHIETKRLKKEPKIRNTELFSII